MHFVKKVQDMIDLIDNKINSLEFKSVFVKSTPNGIPVAHIKFKNLYKPITLHELDNDSVDGFFDKGHEFRSLVMKKMFIRPCCIGKNYGKRSIFETTEVVNAFTEAYFAYSGHINTNNVYTTSKNRDEFCNILYRSIMMKNYPVLDELSNKAEKQARIALSNPSFQNKQKNVKKNKLVANLQKAALGLDNIGISQKEIHNIISEILINKMMNE